MVALRSSLRMLSRGSSVSSLAAYMGEEGWSSIKFSAAIRNFKGCRRFLTKFEVSADKAESCKRTWWQRVKYRMENVDQEERRRIHFAYSVCSLWGHRLPSSSEDSFEDEDSDGIIKQPGWGCTSVVSWSVLFILVSPFVE